MGIRSGLLIAVLLGLLGVFFSIRAGVHSLQTSRRQASWPERHRQVAVGRRYFGLALLLMVMMVGGVAIIPSGNITPPVLLSTPTVTPERTATNIPSETFTNTPTMTSQPAPTGTPTLTATPAQTFTRTPLPGQPPIPTDTLWPTWTPSQTPTISLTPTPTHTPEASSTRIPTHTPLPTDTRWPKFTPTGIK